MECDESEKANAVEVNVEENPTAVNALILDYYKKFGKKRDLEQYFSLSTAQGEVRDPTGLFWRRMKSQNDSSDSGDKKSESSTELCRISIKCTMPEQSTSSQDENSKDKSVSVSPPIITEDATKYSDEESVKSDNISQKSIDLALDTSMNKPLSPTSSITSQRKLEWDSLADVGYGNESDRKTSASSLSTLERLALKQQYSNNDTKQESDLGPPTAHSTFLDPPENKNKGKKGSSKKTTKIHNREVDLVEVNLAQGEVHPQAISVNLTKHISFNVEKDGAVSIENIKKDLNVTPEKVTDEREVTPQAKFDKEIQTTLTKNETVSPKEEQKPNPVYIHKVPVLINLNTLKRRNRRKKIRTVRKRSKSRKRLELDKENIPVQEKSGAQVSEAESFEYMPGHMYNQNQLNQNQSDPKISSGAGNKSSLESSGVLTSDSSKNSKHSFTKDLEKSIDLLKVALKRRYDDPTLKRKLIKDIVQRLLKSNYRDDDTTTDFLSGLSFGSKKIGLGESHTTSSTSDGNHTEEKLKLPKKSILRLDRFNSKALASTSQSAPNLPVASTSEKPVLSKLKKVFTSSNTDSDVSSKKNSSETGFAKTSSEELYQKYLEALRREEAYKKHLKDKENFLRQKLVSSDAAFKIPARPDLKANSKLQDLLKDLTRNNYDDGSGDASKLEGGSNSNVTDFDPYNNIRTQKSHSVFTLSSANSDCCHHRKGNLKKRLQPEIKESKSRDNKDSPCQCGLGNTKGHKIDVADSSVQVNIKNTNDKCCHLEQKKELNQPGSCKLSPRDPTDIKYVCLCSEQNLARNTQGMPTNMYIYKCSRVPDYDLDYANSAATCNMAAPSNDIVNENDEFTCQPSTSKLRDDSGHVGKRNTQSSQTNVNVAFNTRRQCCQSASGSGASSSDGNGMTFIRKTCNSDENHHMFIHEATRCIQTEISINPKISDPCLSDINIIANDCECCKVMHENYRRIYKPNSENDLCNASKCHVENKDSETSMINKQLVSKDSQTEYDVNIRNSIDNAAQALDKGVQSNIETNAEPVPSGSQDPNVIEDNFTIPIQGTNMSLLVSIGSNRTDNDENWVPKNGDQSTDEHIKSSEQMSNAVCEAIGTDEILVAEKGTSVTEECSKGVQSHATEIFQANKTPKHRAPSLDRKKATSCFPIKQNIQTLKKTCIINACVTDAKLNTYPRTVSINEPKLKRFVRSNTDGDRIETYHSRTQEAVVCDGGCAQDISNSGRRDTIYTPYVQENKEVPGEVSEETSKNSFCHSGRRNNKIDMPYVQEHKEVTKKVSEGSSKNSCGCKTQEASDDRTPSLKSSSGCSKDPILDIIKDITRRYSKKDIEKSKRKKCFKEIVTVLNYLLDTDDGEHDQMVASDSDSSREASVREAPANTEVNVDCGSCTKPIKMVDKGVQLSERKSKDHKCCITESSELPSSSDSVTCKVLNKIKQECEKYHQKKYKCGGKKCDASSSTSVNCNQCQRSHHCHCRAHRCKGQRQKTDKVKKKCLAYNLIIQTSDSMVSDEIPYKNCKPLQHIVVKVPPKHKNVENVPFKEVYAKIEKKIPGIGSPREPVYRSRSCPRESEVSSDCNCTPEECSKKCKGYTVRDYLERNRPDFVERSSDRQNCLKMISEKRPQDPRCPPNMKMVVVQPPYQNMGSMEAYNMCCGGTHPHSLHNPCDSRLPCNIPGCFTCNPMHIMSEVTRIANERAAHRQLLSLQLDQRPLSSCSEGDLRRFAERFSDQFRRREDPPKFTSEREMKKHSEKIYKSLPEVVKKKEQIKKDNIKKTNLLMANLFKKNLQKKTLRGAVNLSNYSTVIKI